MYNVQEKRVQSNKIQEPAEYRESAHPHLYRQNLCRIQFQAITLFYIGKRVGVILERSASTLYSFQNHISGYMYYM